MSRILLLLSFFAFGLASLNAQSLKISRYILQTGVIEDGGEIVPVSSDDAEQENDAIDALFDDDIDAGWEGEPDDQNILTAGLRFRDLYIPQGAQIDSAFIIVNSHESKTTEDVARITITAEATDNAETFTETMLIDARPQISTSLLWEVNVEWGLWTYHRTPDLSDIVQEVVNRPGWESGNAIAFLLLGENQGPSEVENAREFESFENIADPDDGGDGQNHPERVPELVVYYSVQNAIVEVPIMVTDTIEDGGEFIPASSDDAEQENDEIDSLFDDDIDTGWEGEPDDQNILTAGLRFRNIGIPQGAIIDSAYIEVFSHETKTAEDVANITIVGNDVDDAVTFTEDQLIDDRVQTAASLLWVVDEPWGLWTPHRTPNISNIVQEIVDRPGWQEGNSIAFILLGENQGPSEVENAREFESYENIADPDDGGDGQNHPERVPRLYIHFSSESAVSTFEVFEADAKTLTVYPNPANNLITIEFENNDAADIRIFDINGRQLSTLKHTFGPQAQVDVSNLSAGVYFVQAIQNGELYIQKVIIE